MAHRVFIFSQTNFVITASAPFAVVLPCNENPKQPGCERQNSVSSQQPRTGCERQNSVSSQQPRTVGTRCLVHQALRCMLDMCHSRHAAASALLSKSDRSLQKNCSECVTAPPRNHQVFQSRILAGRASHAWLSHAPRATTEANTLRCTTEVPVLVNYLSFLPTHHPLGTRQHGNINPSVV